MNSHNEIELLSKLLFDKYGQIVLDTKQTAEVVGKSVIALKTDRINGTGIPYSKMGRLIRYTLTDVAQYIIENRKEVA